MFALDIFEQERQYFNITCIGYARVKNCQLHKTRTIQFSALDCYYFTMYGWEKSFHVRVVCLITSPTLIKLVLNV